MILNKYFIGFILLTFLFAFGVYVNLNNIYKIKNIHSYSNIKQINNLVKLNNNQFLVNNLDKIEPNYVNINNKVFGFKDKFIIWGGEIKARIGYMYKKALYISKGINVDLNNINNYSLLLITNNYKPIICPKGSIANYKDIKALNDKLIKLGFNIFNLTDRAGNKYSVEDIINNYSSQLTDTDKELLHILYDKSCDITVKQKYFFIPKNKIKNFLKEDLGLLSNNIIDVVDYNTNKTLGYIINFKSYNKPYFSVFDNPGITDISQLDEICDDGFYFDDYSKSCKPVLERDLIYYTFFDNVVSNKINPVLSKIDLSLYLSTTGEYYIFSGKNNWIKYGLLNLKNNIKSNNYTADFNAGYTYSIWFKKYNNSPNLNIFSDGENEISIKNGKLQLKVQNKTIRTSISVNNDINNIIITYSQPKKRIGIYFNGNALIKATDNNIYSLGITEDVIIGHNIKLYTGNSFYMFKIWNVGFTDYLIDILYNFEKNLGQNYNNLANPWFPHNYNGYLSCQSSNLQTIGSADGVGIVNCSENIGLPFDILYENSFNKGFKNSILQAEKNPNYLKTKLTYNINDLNYFYNGKELNFNKTYFNKLIFTITGTNGWNIGFVIKTLGNTDIIQNLVKQNNKIITIKGVNFNVSSYPVSVIISTNKIDNVSYACVNDNCKKIPFVNDGSYKFVGGIIDNLFITNKILNYASLSFINNKNLNFNPNYTKKYYCEIGDDGLYTFNNNITYYCKDKYKLLYTSIYSTASFSSNKYINNRNTIRGNGNIKYYTDLVDICRNYDLPVYYVKENGTTNWYNIAVNFIKYYTNYETTKNSNVGIALGIGYDINKKGWYAINNINNNGEGEGDFQFVIGDNLPDNIDGNKGDDVFEAFGFYSSTDNSYGPESFKFSDTIGVICGKKEGNAIVPMQIFDYNNTNLNLSDRIQYIYTFDDNQNKWLTGDFYSCPVGKDYNTETKQCLVSKDGNYFYVYDLQQAYNKGYNIPPLTKTDADNIQTNYFNIDYLMGAQITTGGLTTDSNSGNNIYDLGSVNYLYSVYNTGFLCFKKNKVYNIKLNGSGSLDFSIKINSEWYNAHIYNNVIDENSMLNVDVIKGCYPIRFRYFNGFEKTDNWNVYIKENDETVWRKIKNNLKIFNN